MRVVALPSIYEREFASRPKPNMTRIWIALAAGVVLPLIVAGFEPSLIWPMAAVAVAWAMCVGFYLLMNSSRVAGQGELGERSALRALSRLPDDYVAITNCKIPGYEQIGDLDIVLLGPPGVIVVEVKNFLRPVIVDGDAWAMRGRYTPTPLKSVSRQLEDEVKALTKFLIRAQAPAPVHGIIAINGNANIHVVKPPEFPIVPYDTLSKAVRKLPAPGVSPLLDVIERKLCSPSTPMPT